MTNEAAGLALGVSEFVALLNQTLDYAYPAVTITGELANFRVSKNRWVYFDLKDEAATLRFFGTVYQLPGPLEDGMMLAVQGNPRLHPQYGFSVNVLRMKPVGEGSIKKAAALLQKKLTAEGLFDPSRKRSLPYPPRRVGLITSAESAAYRDFVKVLGERWRGLEVEIIDVQVQGDPAPAQITAAIEQFNQMADPPDVLVITRGGGSAEDLAAFGTEQVIRAVAASRVPTLVAIGHEVDLSLAELAADQRASTPSNAAELLTPDRRHVLASLETTRKQLGRDAQAVVGNARLQIGQSLKLAGQVADRTIAAASERLKLQRQLLTAFNPSSALQRGYTLVSAGEVMIRSGQHLAEGDTINIQFADARVTAEVKQVKIEKQ